LANDEGYPIRLFRNRRTGKRFLAVTEPNGDVIYAGLDENDKPINAGNRDPRDEFNIMLDEFEQEADCSTYYEHGTTFTKMSSWHLPG
jgi:hypothetical protein